MILSQIKRGCRVGFFGLGISNSSLLRSLPLHSCSVTIRSDKIVLLSDIPDGLNIDHVYSGEDACIDIVEDIIFFSPSVRRDRVELMEAKKRGVIFTSDAELFFEENTTPTFLVTGSDGKSTAATLINMLLNKAGYSSQLIGNIGEPMWKKTAEKSDFYVFEASSFMLTYLTPRVKAACITNITPNHLDWHKNFDEYRAAKLSVTESAERLIIGDDNIGINAAYGIISSTRSYRELTKLYCAEVYMTVEDGYICRNREKILRIDCIRRKEPHNLKNLMMAIAMTDGMIRSEEISWVAEDFGGLRHRCEFIPNSDGVDYIDSSIDSTPQRTLETLTSLNREVVIILGGRGKRLDYRDMIPALRKYARGVVVCGENAEEIYSIVKDQVKTIIASDFDEAICIGRKMAKSVGTLLLSPASTSYDRFKNYAERGDYFRDFLLKNK